MPDGAARLRAAFPGDRAALIPYVMGGYPTVAESLDYARALAAHADILELGIPFSDPLADGPTIQAAGQRALENGTRPGDVIALAEALRGGPPVVLMTYVTLVLAAGPEAFFARAASAGVAGAIIPDLPLDEGDAVRTAARAAGVAIVPLAAPTTTDARLAAIGRQADAFTYLVSVAGVTGGELAVDTQLRAFVQRARQAIVGPLAVGFGIRTPAQARAIGEFADGVVIASHLIRLIDEAPSHDAAVAALGAYGAELRDALAGAARAS
jgi:tryptophan synthase alpha chain